VVLELCCYFYIAFLQSREIALAYYFGFRLWAGMVAGMFLYVVFRNAKVFLAASAVLLVAFNVFVIARHLGDRKCRRKSRSSFVGHPSAQFFERFRGREFFNSHSR
jgi:hypothetical protein